MKHSWFRLYTEVLDDPKVGQLSDPVFRTWINLMCLVKRQPVVTFRSSFGHGGVIGGVLPRQKAVIYALRIDHKKWARHRDDLISAGLLDIVEVDGKKELALHGWAGRQFLSDSSAERMKRHRDRHSDVTSAVTVTPPEYRVQSTPLTPRAGGDCDAPDFAPDFDALNLSWPRNRRATPDQIARALVGLPAYASDPAGTWRRITANARNYLRTPEAGRGIVQRLDRWISSGAWLHHDEGDAGETPLVSVDQYEDWLREDAQ
jgi:hypothetical protein